jgi:hypothetical protein
MRLVAVSTAIVLLASTMAASAATYDPSTNTGHVSSGEMKNLFGDSVLTVTAAESVEFSSVRLRKYRTLCRKQGSTQTQTVEARRTFYRFLTSSVDVNPQGKVTGWDITGVESTRTNGRVCPEGWRPAEKPVLLGTTDFTLRAEFEGDIKRLGQFQ